MSILAGVKGYMNHVILGYKYFLQLKNSLGNVNPLKWKESVRLQEEVTQLKEEFNQGEVTQLKEELG